jgi:shikimate kinase
MRKHIVLVGLPGAGKSTVGRLVAERLGASFFDTDGMIVRKMQMPIARIIGEHGELKFRDMERQAMAQALNGPPAVISPGGGWVAQPGALESAQANSYLVYLKTMVLTAAKRAGGEGTRPLLVGEDPVEKMRTLLKEREPFYIKANAEVKGDIKTAPQLADEIVALAKQNAGW